MMEQFKALMVDKNENDFSVQVKNITLNELPQGDVLIKVVYSAINYKDGLASIPNGKIVTTSKRGYEVVASTGKNSELLF